MRVSHEAIYLSLFVQARGALRKELTQALRSGRAMRFPRAKRRPCGHGQLVDTVPISQRPAEVADRAVPGHWEGDLVFGTRPSAIAPPPSTSTVERHSRFVMLVALPAGCTAEQVRPALAQAVQRMPAQLRKSLTWDRGMEMAQHARFPPRFAREVPPASRPACRSTSPTRAHPGSAARTRLPHSVGGAPSNGLLRQYLPKGADLRAFSQADLDEIAARLNGRPRQTLGWQTPSEVLNEALR